jgi:hypothetical protein
MTKKAPQEAAATAKFPVTKIKTAQIADLTQKAADFAKANPQYANQPAVQQAVTTWLASAASAQKIDTNIKNARVALMGFTATRHAAIAEWKRSTKSMLATIDQVAGGSAKSIKEWGFDVSTRTTSVESDDPPTGLRVTYNRALELVIQWKGIRGHMGYNLQIGDGSPTGWGPVIQVTKSKYMPTGLVAGQHIAIRVAVQRKSGLSGYCDAVNALVR